MATIICDCFTCPRYINRDYSTISGAISAARRIVREYPDAIVQIWTRQGWARVYMAENGKTHIEWEE